MIDIVKDMQEAYGLRREVPKTKVFPDGDYVRYWRDKDDENVIWAQLFKKNGRKVRQKFTYEGP